MRNPTPLLFSAVLVLATLTATPAFAQQRSTAWLLEQLSAQCQHQASQAQAAHHDAEAKTWQGWAGLYGSIAKAPEAQTFSALDFARRYAGANGTQATQAEKKGEKDTADFYRATAKMWADLAHQLEQGGAVTIRLPEKQMLKPIPGLADTPWQKLTADGSNRARIECQALAKRARDCNQHLSEMISTGLIRGNGNGDVQAVMRERCNRDEELYVARCGKQ